MISQSTSCSTYLLGEILVSKGLIDPQQLEECLEIQQHCQKKLGAICVERSILSLDQLEQILQEQQWRNGGYWVID